MECLETGIFGAKIFTSSFLNIAWYVAELFFYELICSTTELHILSFPLFSR